MLKKLVLIVSLLIIAPVLTMAQGSHPLFKYDGYLKELGTLSFDNGLNLFHYDNLLHNRINTHWQFKPNWTAEIDLRTRLFNGYSVRHIPEYAKIISQDNGLVDLSWNLINTRNTVLNTQIDRFYTTFYANKWELDIGRQRINWGKTLVWNPNDLFNTYSYLDFDYEEKPGTDAIRFQYFSGFASGYEVAFKPGRHSLKESVAAFLARLHKGLYDFQLLGGYYHNQMVFGGGWAGSIGQAGFKGELSVYHPLYIHPEKQIYLLLSSSIDYAFTNGLYVNAEFLYNGNAPSQLNPRALFSESLQANNLFITRTAGFAQATYPVTPLINAGVAIIEGLSNQLTILVPQISYSLTNNIDFLLLSQIIRNHTIEQIFPTPNLVYGRLRWSF